MEQIPLLRRWSFGNKQMRMVPNKLGLRSKRFSVHEIRPKSPKHNHARWNKIEIDTTTI